MAQYDLDLRDYWRIVRKRKLIIVFTTVAMGIFSLVFSYLGKPVPKYRASASVKVEKSTSETGLYLRTISWSQTDNIETQMSMIESYFVMEKAAKDLGMIPADLPTDEVRANRKYLNIILGLKSSVETAQEGDSDIIDIRVVSENPAAAARLANTIARVYKEERTISLNRRTIEGKKFLENQRKTVKERLSNSEDVVRRFREENKLISLNSQTGSLLSQMDQLQKTYEKYLSDHQKVGAVMKLLERAGDQPLTSETNYYISEASSLYKSLNDRLVQKMMARDTLLLTFTENYPQVVEINKEIDELVANMRSQLASQEKVLADGTDSLQKSIEEQEALIKSLPQKGMELARLERAVQINMEIYTLLETKYQESLIQEAEMIEEVEIVKPALEPTTPINPTNIWSSAAVGTIIGLILGIVFAFLIETMDTSIGAIEEVEEFLGAPVLGVIPYVPVQEMRASLEDRYGGEVDDETANRNVGLVSHFAPKSVRAESYRALRTNLSFTSLERDVKTIVFTSSSPEEGKTSAAANLAITMAQAGNKVLLVDADLRRPVVAGLFGIDRAPGLTDYILGNYEWRDIVRTITDIMTGKMSIDDVMHTPGIDNLSIITSGTSPPNPADLVSSKRLSEFIEEARSENDMVLVDAPPVLSATDAAIMGTKSDGVVMIYWVGRISRGILKRAKGQLDSVRVNFMGVILNGLRADVSPDLVDYDYYMKYYGPVDAEEKQTFFDTLLSIPGRIIGSFRAILGRDQEAVPEESESKSPKWKIIVLLIALLVLVAGVLYQAGFFDSPNTGEGPQEENALVGGYRSDETTPTEAEAAGDQRVAEPQLSDMPPN